MFTLKDFFHRNGIWVIVAALLLTAALSLGSALFPNLTSPLSNAIGIVASPFQKATSSFTGWGGGLYDYAFRYVAGSAIRSFRARWRSWNYRFPR